MMCEDLMGPPILLWADVGFWLYLFAFLLPVIIAILSFYWKHKAIGAGRRVSTIFAIVNKLWIGIALVEGLLLYCRILKHVNAAAWYKFLDCWFWDIKEGVLVVVMGMFLYEILKRMIKSRKIGWR